MDSSGGAAPNHDPVINITPLPDDVSVMVQSYNNLINVLPMEAAGRSTGGGMASTLRHMNQFVTNDSGYPALKRCLGQQSSGGGGLKISNVTSLALNPVAVTVPHPEPMRLEGQSSSVISQSLLGEWTPSSRAPKALFTIKPLNSYPSGQDAPGEVGTGCFQTVCGSQFGSYPRDYQTPDQYATGQGIGTRSRRGRARVVKVTHRSKQADVPSTLTNGRPAAASRRSPPRILRPRRTINMNNSPTKASPLNEAVLAFMNENEPSINPVNNSRQTAGLASDIKPDEGTITVMSVLDQDDNKMPSETSVINIQPSECITAGGSFDIDTKDAPGGTDNKSETGGDDAAASKLETDSNQTSVAAQKAACNNSQVDDKLEKDSEETKSTITVLDYKIVCPHCNFILDTTSRFHAHLDKAHKIFAKVFYILSRSDQMFAFCPCCKFVAPSGEYEKAKLHVLCNHVEDLGFVELNRRLADHSLQDDDLVLSIWKRILPNSLVILKVPSKSKKAVDESITNSCSMNNNVLQKYSSDARNAIDYFLGSKPKVSLRSPGAPLLQKHASGTRKPTQTLRSKPNMCHQRVVIPRSSATSPKPSISSKKASMTYGNEKKDGPSSGQNQLSEVALSASSLDDNGLPSNKWLNTHHPDATLCQTYFSHLDKCLVSVTESSVPQGMREVCYEDHYIAEESGSLRCEICSEIVPSQPPIIAEEHVSQHFQLRLWACAFCLTRRPTRYKIIKHLLDVHPTLPLVAIRSKPATKFERTKELRHADIVFMEHWFPGARVEQAMEPTGEITFTIHVEKDIEPPDDFSISDYLTPRKSPVCVCKICGTIFLKPYKEAPKVANIVSHIHSHFRKKTLSCMHCEWVRNNKCSREQLIVHLRVAHPSRPFILVLFSSFSSVGDELPPHASVQPIPAKSKKHPKIMATRFKLWRKHCSLNPVRKQRPRFVHTCLLCARQLTSHDQFLYHVTLVHPEVEYDSSMSQRKRRIPLDYATEAKNIVKGVKKLRLSLPRISAPGEGYEKSLTEECSSGTTGCLDEVTEPESYFDGAALQGDELERNGSASSVPQDIESTKDALGVVLQPPEKDTPSNGKQTLSKETLS